MRTNITRSVLALSLAAVAGACSGKPDKVEEQAEAKDTARVDTTRAFGGTTREPAARPSARRPRVIATSRADITTEGRRPGKRLTVASGTEIEAVNVTTITSRRNNAGDRVTARVLQPVMDGNDTVIPAGATLTGVVQAIAPAENPRGEGVLRIAFGSATWDGITYPIHVQVKEMGAGMHNRGMTTGDAAKVGAGTVAGAVAGRVIGGNRRGTIIGAAAGTVAGAVVANQTRDVDIVLPEGGRIRLELTQPFAPEIASAKP